MVIDKRETKYNIGDVVIIPWQTKSPELAMVVGINIEVDDDEEYGTCIEHIYKVVTYRTHGSEFDDDTQDFYEENLLCKVEDASKYTDLIKKGFAEGGISETETEKAVGAYKGEDE